MIVQRLGDQFIMIKQHDHALVSGEMAKQWKKEFLLRSRIREEADRAVAQHDRAWIPIDEQLLWNEGKQRPYSFIDYPLKDKLSAYQRGIEEMAEKSLYAAILCSMHYQSFFKEDSNNADIRRFVEEEKSRQERLYAAMEKGVPKDIFYLHFERLQFCDDLSLYICMQQPGTPKDEQVPWFRNGFRQIFEFAPNGMMAEWVDQECVSIDPFPFEDPLEVHVPYRVVSKVDVELYGLEQAFHEATVQYRKVTFVPNS